MIQIDINNIFMKPLFFFYYRFYSFTSIPFAKPPLGKLRFLPPEPLEVADTETVLDATGLPPSCPQYNNFNAEGLQKDPLSGNIIILK